MQFGIAEAVEHWGRFRPSSIAAYANARAWTYAEINGLAAAMAIRIDAAATGEQRVAVAFGRKIHLLAAILGVLRSGRSVVLLNTGLPIEDSRVNISDAGVGVLLCDESNSSLAGLVATAVVVPADLSPSPVLPPLKQRGASNEWGVLFSSGTTGVPKGIERDHESMVTELVGWCLELGLTRRTRFYIGRPVYYTGGLVLTLATLLVGGAAVLNDSEGGDSFDQTWDDYQGVLADQDVDYAFFIPDQLRRFLTIADGHKTRSARVVLTMGGPITGDAKRQIVAAFGCELVESWGNSESLGTITDPEDVAVRPNSIGRPFLTDEMCIVDDDYEPVAPTALGRLAGSVEGGFLKYSNRPTETALARRNELIISEDLGYADASGYFYLRGRVQECVLLQDGSTVFLRDLEGAISLLPTVRDCCVVTAPGTGSAVEFLVAIVPTSPQEGQQWGEAVQACLTPRIIVAQIRVFDQIPRVPSGKLNRPAVQRAFERAA